MFQAANTDLFNPFVLKAHNSECQKLLFPLQINPVNDSLLGWLTVDCFQASFADFWIFIFAPSALMG